MTKDPRRPSRWTNREIEADSAGYIAAQEAEREDRAEAERDALLALMRGSGSPPRTWTAPALSGMGCGTRTTEGGG